MTDIAAVVADKIYIWTGAVQRKSSAGRGGGKRISLYGIERLRALILDVAVRGRLVPQDAGDEPASELLKRLGFKPKSSPELPTGWTEATLSQLGAFLGGITPSKGTKRFWGNGVPWVSPKDMGDLEVIARSEDEITQAALDETSLQIVPVGALLMVARSGILRRKFPLAITAVECTINQDMKAFIPRPEISARYIQVMLMGFQPRVLMALVKRGMTVESLIFDDFVKAVWPIPPLAEQRRIVAKVDELMALCDALERESAGAMAAHQALVEALLATLVNSADAADLARQWSRLERHFDTLFTTDTSIDTLKQTILDLAMRGKLVEPETPSLKKWIESPLEKLISPMDSGWSPACHEYPSTSDDVWGVLKTTAVQDMRYDAEQSKALPERFEPRLDAEVRVGDVLITRAGPTNRVGICCFVAATRPRLMISDKIIRFRPILSVIEGAFLALALSVGKAAQQIEKAKSGMAASQVNISQSKLKAIIVPVPPLAEQRRIVTKVDALMALCDALKARIADAAQTQCLLADALTERAAA